MALKSLSKQELQRKLDLPRTQPSRGDNPSCRCKRGFPIGASREDLPGYIREGKVGVVENIEEFRPELQCPAFAQPFDRRIFYEREVQVGHAGTSQNISSRGSQVPEGLEGKGTGVEVAVWAAQDDVPRAASRRQVRPIEICSARSRLPGVDARARAVGPQRWCERISGLNGHDAARPPAVQHGAERPALEGLWQLIDGIELPVVPQIKVRRAAVHPPIEGVHAKDAGNLAIRPRLSLSFIDELGPGVGALELQAVAQRLVQPDL